MDWFAAKCRIEHYFPQIVDAFALPLKFFFARYAECEKLRQYQAGEDDGLVETLEREVKKLGKKRDKYGRKSRTS